MTMLNTRGNSGRRNEPTLPKAGNVAPPPERIYSEEVLSFLQQNADNKHMIVQLEGERDDWRRKYLTEKAERERLEALLAQEAAAHEQATAKLAEDRDRKIDLLTAARDDYKTKLTRFETALSIQGNGVLNLANSVADTMRKLMEEIRIEKGASDVAGAAGLAAVADAIEGEQMPKAVTAGPAPQEEVR